MKDIYLTFSFSICSLALSAQLQLHKYYANSAILQRDKPIVIPGIAMPNDSVKVILNEHRAHAITDDKGYFELQLSALPPGGPFILKVSTKDTIIELHDILIGDVWFASGQSNMEWPLIKTENSSDEIRNTSNSNIRFFRVKKNMEFSVIDSVKSSSSWIKGDSNEVRNVSGVAYYFAKKINKETKVPIGIIQSSWGATGIETWMSRKAMEQFPYTKDLLNKADVSKESVASIEAKAKKVFDEWLNKEYRRGIGINERWYLRQSDLSDWKDIYVPGYWEDQLDELKFFDGVVWYRKSFNVSSDFLDKDIRIWLSQIDDHNMCWINGVFIGETVFKDSWTNYRIPMGILKEKGNEIVLRIFDMGDKGGTTGLDTYFDFYPEGNPEIRGRLNGQWKIKTDYQYISNNEVPLSASRFNPNQYYSLVYNAMVYPFKKIPIKGVIWYQGEQNKSNAQQYSSLFPAMINDWRALWGNENLPFYYTQIANHGIIPQAPTESAAAELREAQTMALLLPYTGMACTIDIGNPDDIHPKNKKDVGQRLARHALKNQYGFQDLITDGPQYKNHYVKKDEIILELTNSKGLYTIDGKEPAGFAIAGKDLKFYWAETALVKNKDKFDIKLKNGSVSAPVYIRYAWADSPLVNLVNAHGLPVYPFRTDNLKRTTEQ